MGKALLTTALVALFLLPAQAGAVVGGQPASKPYPWIAAMTDNRGEWSGCGGSLVRQDWVLTAAHCVVDTDPKDVGWLVGTHDISTPEKGDEVPAAEIFVHEKYDADDKEAANSYDVALVRLSRPAAKGAPIRVPAPAEKTIWAPGKMAWAIGWGTQVHYDPGLTASDTLNEVDVPMVSDADCGRFYAVDEPSGMTTGKFENKTMVCAGYQQGMKDTCFGDSGGPLMVPDSTGALVQVGVVSWGFGCAMPAQYGVYARVADTTLYDWIRAKLPSSGTPTFAAPPAAGGAAAAASSAAQPSSSESQAAPRTGARPAHGSKAAAKKRKATKLAKCLERVKKLRSRSARKRAQTKCRAASRRLGVRAR